jgi:hypothetical protein
MPSNHYGQAWLVRRSDCFVAGCAGLVLVPWIVHFFVSGAAVTVLRVTWLVALAAFTALCRGDHRSRTEQVGRPSERRQGPV